jgi:hypothetical protein
MSHRIFGGIRVIAFVSVVLLLGSADPSYALFEKLDHLSGPGPFHGVELQFRTLCRMNQPSRTEALSALSAAVAASEPALGARLSAAFDDEFNKRVSELFGRVDQPITPAEFLELAARSRKAAGVLRSSGGANSLPAVAAWERSEEVLRQASIPSLRHSPGISLWASCYDRPLRSRNHKYTLPGTTITEIQRYDDRHPTFSLNLNYRYYTTGGWLGLDRLKGSEQYANGKDIHLHVFEVQPTWPVSGRLDVLDASVGLGLYVFTSEGFETFHGTILEPVRLDFHFPARLLDQSDNSLLRILTAVSLRAGYVLFPSGIPAAKFNASRRVSRDIPRDELTFGWGVVVDVGRLAGK